jgi:protein-cysteine N-palmitoyltransferase HHAT
MSSIIVFSFVALWHDLSFRLLAWGWLVTLFILPELAARQLLPSAKVRPFWFRQVCRLIRRPVQFGMHPWYRHVCALGAVGNILMMMTANLVGFALGTEGMGYMAREIAGSWSGASFLPGLYQRQAANAPCHHFLLLSSRRQVLGWRVCLPVRWRSGHV